MSTKIELAAKQLQLENIKNVGNTLDILLNMFCQELISADDQKLLDFAFLSNPTQADLENFISGWDIEEFGGDKALMLAYAQKAHPNLKFPQYAGPRLNGLLKFHRFANLELIAHYTKICKELNKNGIVPLIIKGGALKYLRPELPRSMGDIDIVLATAEEFEQAKQIAGHLGYVFEINDSHSIDLHLPNSEAGILDIHRWFDFDCNYNKEVIKDIFKRAMQKNVFGTNTLVPAFEDIMFIGLLNLAKNLHRKTSIRGILYTLFDCLWLKSQPEFNWQILLQNTIKSQTEVPMTLAVKFANMIVPNLLPEDFLHNRSIKKELNKYLNAVYFYRVYIHELKMRCKKLKIKNALRNKEIMQQWIKDKPKHFVLKRINKSAFLIDIFLKLAGK